jgi:regulator of PEP synthase PpsR (kinase-PPPase family)
MRRTRTLKKRSPNGNFIGQRQMRNKIPEPLVKKHIARNEIRGDECDIIIGLSHRPARYQNIRADRFSSATHAGTWTFVSAQAECLLHGNAG